MINFKLYFRNILKNKVFSIITIGSFAISIAIIIILAAFIVSEYSYDNHIENVDCIYRVKASENEVNIPEEARNLLLSKIPEIEAATNYCLRSEPLVYNENNYEAVVINSDEGLFSILPIKFLMGSPKGIFTIKNNVVITESLSKSIFGVENPIGKTINISHNKDALVAAVIQDFPEKSTLSGDLICSTDLRINYSSDCYNDSCTYFYKMLVKIAAGSNIAAINSKITSVIPNPRQGESNVYTLLPYKNVYFDTSFRGDNLKHANIKLIHLLAWLAILLLFLAVFNYVNLCIAQNTTRFKEFGVKKTFGARRKNVFVQLIGETLFTTLISTVFSFIIAFILLPVFIELFGKEFSLYSLVHTPVLVLISIISIGAIAVVSAIYPAQIATKANAKELLQKLTFKGASGFNIRKILNILQFAVTIAILISFILITKQIKFAKNINFGFSTEQLIRIPLHWRAADKVDILIEKLNQIPGLKKSCASHGTPGGIYNYSEDDKMGRTAEITSNYRFIETFGLSVIQGRNFFENEKKPACLINKTAMKQAGWDNIDGKSIFGYEVVGLMDDFRYQDIYNKIAALIISNGKDVSNISLRLQPQNAGQTLISIEKVFKEVLPEYGFSFQFYDEFLDSSYKQEEKIADSIKIMALIAILISCIGIFGIEEFLIKNRIKEIGIRKINGAKTQQIVLMLNKDLLKWISIAFVIACPIAWYIMNKWLENFAYKTELSWWIFALAGLLAFVVDLLTVSWQSWRAAIRNPVESLRYE